ncbi:MAG: homoserine kinase, partial [Acidobacteriota bacterium]|nr:homoserine kinase [Acidobacteriota bacterium]
MQAIRLRLPATSANLGPGFDAVGLAMGLWLQIDASAAPEGGGFRIAATGRDSALCASLERNLILDTYRDVLRVEKAPAPALHLTLENGIPLGMGCGSSAAALLGGVLLASHFGGLGWSLYRCMEEASRREGHPDNVAACALGWTTVSCGTPEAVPGQGTRVIAATCGQDLPWRLLLALPSASLATEKARALLPAEYTRADAVANVQRTALLVAAFAQGRGELLHTAMQDRMHQPYRMAACPLLARLLPLSGTPGFPGVALSGAGPGVLVIADPENDPAAAVARVREAAGDPELEVIETRMVAGASV